MPSKKQEDKTKKILKVLRDNPEGLWIRELARKSNLDKSTVSRYAEKELADKVEWSYFGRNKVLRLK
jgi:DNA-binding Lrp family transcriptional regulator